jgi:tetratricopeptide (TPR) repeat protein
MLPEMLSKAWQLLRAGDFDRAQELYRHILRGDPSQAEAWYYLGELSLHRRRWPDAIDHFERCVRLTPDNAAAQSSLGIALLHERRFPDAEQCFRLALQLQPDSADLHNHLGIVLSRQRRIEQAVHSFREALRLAPNLAEAENNWGSAYALMGRYDEAEPHFQRAIELMPDYAEAHTNLSDVWLHRGDFERGFREYEWRWWQGHSPPRPILSGFSQPLWDGSPLAGQTILLHAESGLGDALQMIRYAPIVKACRGRVIVACQEPLVSLFARCPGVDQVVCRMTTGAQGVDTPRSTEVHSYTGLPPFDTHAPLLSLPRIFQTTLVTIPANVPYLFTDPELVEKWTKEIATFSPDETDRSNSRSSSSTLTTHHAPPLRIGIFWQGNPEHANDLQRSVPLKRFESIARLNGVKLFGLQKGTGLEQLTEVPDKSIASDLGSRLGSFADTAAVLKCLDLLITVDSAVAHCAGALAVPVWVLVPFVCDWRWMAAREDNPWYPTMRLFRQITLGDWDAVFERLENALKVRVRNAREEIVTAGDQAVSTPCPTVPPLSEPPHTITFSQVVEPSGAPRRDSAAAAAQPTRGNTMADEYYRAGLASSSQGEQSQAEWYFRQAIQIDPAYAEVYANLADCLAATGRLQESILYFREAARLKPQWADAHNALGLALEKDEKSEEAIRCYRRALEVKPDYLPACNNLGAALEHGGKLEEAAEWYRRALQLEPDRAEVHSNLGCVLIKMGNYAEAELHHRQAVELGPDLAQTHCNMGKMLTVQGRVREAVARYERAIELKPDYAKAHCDLGMVWMQMGDFERGWPEYEWRWRTPGRSARPFTQPIWDGGPLQGRTILLHAEQGFGDTLQFIRYAPLIKQRGGRILVECQASLLSLLSSCRGIDRVIPQRAPLPAFDVHAPLLSLPAILRTTLATIPAKVPYLAANANLARRWRKEINAALADGPGQNASSNHSPIITLHSPPLKIGIAWQGNPDHPNDRQRSLRLVQFAPLADLPGVRLFSLQNGPGTEQLTEAANRFPIVDLGSRFETFDDTAAAMANLDLVISVDSAVAHCAGALRVPVWTLLACVRDWRWLLKRQDSPWYPSMRLFGQAWGEGWGAVIARVVDTIRQRIRK